MPNKKINALDVKVAVSTDLMLVGDPSTGTAYKSTLATLPLVPTSRTITINGVAFDLSANRAWTIGTVTSVGLSMPNAFGVANSPITSSGTLAVTALGTASQYIRGDGQLATLPSGASGGSSVAYYLNGGTAASVGTYYQMSTTAVLGAAADFNLVGNGLISQFLTDVGDPNRLEIPAGNWNFEMYFNISSSGGNTAFYVELLKYDGTTFTSIASNVGTPEAITGGTSIDLYLTSLAIPQTTLLVTDRLALRVYIVNNSGGRTVILHTQDSHLCEIITNFAGGISALNGLTANTQYFATGTSGTDFGISSVLDTHTFNLPTASATNRGALSSADWSIFNNKVPSARTLTINGTAYDLSADRSWTISSDNIYNANGILTGNRTLTQGGFNLTFVGSTHTNRFTAAGRLLLGTTSESTFLLDVNGTARVSGATTVGGQLTVSNAIIPTAIFQHSGSAANTTRLSVYGPAFSPLGVIINAVGSSDTTFTAEMRNKGGLTCPTGFWITTNNAGSVGNGDVAFYAFQSKSISINSVTEYASAQFAIDSTTKGFLPPRMTTTQRDAIATPATGLVVYVTDSTEGLYERTSTAWRLINASGGGGSMAIGGAITSATAGSVLFAGTSGVLQQNNANFFWDNANFRLGLGTTTPTRKLEVVGSDAFINTLTIGRGAGNVQINSAFGYQALNANTSGDGNTALGNASLKANTTGYCNTGVGSGALTAITTGVFNTAIGFDSLKSVTSNFNVAIGSRSAQSITTGTSIIAIGHEAFSGGVASNNIMIGRQAGSTLTSATANDNVLIGNVAGNFSSGFSKTTLVGQSALSVTSTGINNTAIGYQAGLNNTTGSNNIFIGVSVSAASATDSNRTFIGNSSTTSTWLGGNLLLGSTTDNGARVQITGKLAISAGTTGASQINLASSTAPTSPNNGDIWFDGTDLKMRIGGVTKTFTII